MSDYMEVSCRYCKENKLIACENREYSNGLFVVTAICDGCGKSQKHSNKPKKNLQVHIRKVGTKNER